MVRDKASLDIFRLRDGSLEDTDTPGHPRGRRGSPRRGRGGAGGVTRAKTSNIPRKTSRVAREPVSPHKPWKSQIGPRTAILRLPRLLRILRQRKCRMSHPI